MWHLSAHGLTITTKSLTSPLSSSSPGLSLTAWPRTTHTESWETRFLWDHIAVGNRSLSSSYNLTLNWPAYVVRKLSCNPISSTSRYQQGIMADSLNDRELSISTIYFVRYYFNRPPFGITSAPEHWWRLSLPVNTAPCWFLAEFSKNMTLAYLQPWKRYRVQESPLRRPSI